MICAMEADNALVDEDAVLTLLEEALQSGVITEEGTGTRITYHFWILYWSVISTIPS